MPYYEYYSFSYFFLIILLFFLLILILFPNYTKKDIVPPLSNANYVIDPTSIGTFITADTNNSTFSNLIILDGASGGTDAIDFGASEGDTASVSYIPYYEESHKRIIGFFELNIGTSLSRDLAFRVVDTNQQPSSNLSRYNYGWTSLNTESIAGTTGLLPINSTPVYRVNLPFNIPGSANRNHNISVQIAASGLNTGLELSSAYLYYYAV